MFYRVTEIESESFCASISSNMAESDELDSIPFELTETDRANLAAGDDKFVPHDWEDLKIIIGSTVYL